MAALNLYVDMLAFVCWLATNCCIEMSWTSGLCKTGVQIIRLLSVSLTHDYVILYHGILLLGFLLTVWCWYILILIWCWFIIISVCLYAFWTALIPVVAILKIGDIYNE